MVEKNRQNKTIAPFGGDDLFSPTAGKAAGLAFSLSSLFYLALSAIFLLVLSSYGITDVDTVSDKDWYLYISFLLPQAVLFLAIAFFFLWTRTPFKQEVKEQKCHWKYFLIAIVLQFGLLALGELNNYFGDFLAWLGYSEEAAEINVPSLNGFGFVGVLLTVAFLPAVFEEIFFRGVLLKGLRSFGTVGAVLLCGAFFALYHQNPVQTIYQFLCGAAFALVVIRSGSLLPTMLSHFLNNALLILLEKFGVGAIPSPWRWILLGVEILVLIGSLVYLIFFDKTKKPREELSKKGKKSERIFFFICAAFGILLCSVVWISMLVSGFKGA